MTASQNALILSVVSYLLTSYSEILYVSKYGTDYTDCGLTLDTACGTLYGATANVYFFYNSSSKIVVYDGQNKDEINKYFMLNATNIWHPCLPHPNATILSITFNDQYIHTMSDWFMNGTCYQNNHYTRKYQNIYLFDQVLNLNNLRIDNYDTDIIPFSIFNCRSWICPQCGAANFTCHNCVFANISYTIDIPMINVLIDGITFYLSLINCTFKNMYSTANLITVSGMSELSQSYVTLSNVFIIDVTFQTTMFHFDSFYSERVPFILIVIFSKCKLAYIHTEPTIIHYGHITYYLDINETTFENIIHGSIIRSSYNPLCTMHNSRVSVVVWVSIDNVYISSSQTKAQNPSGLFQFQKTENITITHLNVMYYYNLSVNCHFVDETASYYCINPVSLIYNNGYVVIRNNSFNITVFDDNFIND
eukprot:516554_1